MIRNHSHDPISSVSDEPQVIPTASPFSPFVTIRRRGSMLATLVLFALSAAAPAFAEQTVPTTVDLTTFDLKSSNSDEISTEKTNTHAVLVRETSQPITGTIRFHQPKSRSDVLPDSDAEPEPKPEPKPERDEASVEAEAALWNVVVTSSANGQIVDRIRIACRDKTDQPTPQKPTPTNPDGQSSQRSGVGYELKGSQVLAPGVYDLRLEPSVTTNARWRDLLPWERGGAKAVEDSTIANAAPCSWTLVVVPSVSAAAKPETVVGEPKARDSRRCFVRWSNTPQLKSDDVAAASESPVSSRFTRIFSGGDREGPLPYQRWANALASIDQRLDTIVASSVDAIVLDLSNRSDGGGNSLACDESLTHYVHAKAQRLGLEVWEILPDEASSVRSASSSKSEIGTSDSDFITLARIASDSLDRSTSDRLSVAVFLRPPAGTIQGHFPPAMRTSGNPDLVWFGTRSDNPVDSMTTDEETLTTDATPASGSAFPLLQIDDAFASNAWLSDWVRWCLDSTQGPQSESVIGQVVIGQGLFVDESFFNGEVIPESASVRDAVQLWKLSWARDSRWLKRSAGSEKGSSTGVSTGSLVHVRHANIDSGTTLVCINQAPWPMRIQLPTAGLAAWTLSAPPTLESIRLTTPVSDSNGDTIVVPPSSVVVCHSTQPVASKIRFTAEIDGARHRKAMITRQVTAVVENLGLLGELAGITSRSHASVQSMVTAELSTGRERFAKTMVPPRPGSPDTETETNANRNGSLWSSDRWGFGRSVSRQSETDVRTPCRNLVINGGFESRHDLGIPGWMHAHHPADAVVLDSLVRCEGNNAIRMSGKTKTGSSSWLISREIMTPTAGRIGVSMSLRSEPDLTTDPADAGKSKQEEPAPPIEIRVAVEGERDGQPIRRTQTVSVPSDGKWQTGRVVLEWLDIDPARDRNLRLTIDNFAPTSIWIDDVVVTDYFASSAERTELQSLAYLAVQGLQHNDWQPAAKLLSNFWARDLLRVANRNSASMRTNPESELGLGPDASDGGRSHFDTRGMPAPMWRDTEINDRSDTLSGGKTATELLAPPATRPAQPPLSESAPPEPSDESKEKNEPPESIAGRIRSWLPAPLRF